MPVWDVTEHEYQTDKRYTRSGAVNCILNDGPSVYYRRYEPSCPPNLQLPGETSDSMALGSLEHAMLLDHSQLDDFVPWSGGTRRGKAWDAFSEANAGKTIVTGDQWYAATEMASAVRAHPEARKILDHPQAVREQAITFDWCGIECKCKVDIRIPGYVFDVKTTRGLNPNRERWLSALGCRQNRAGGWYLAQGGYGYHRQLAFYKEGICDGIVTGIKPRRYGHIVVSTVPPYIVWVHLIGTNLLDSGREDCVNALNQIRERRESGDWTEPGQLSINAEPLDVE